MEALKKKKSAPEPSAAVEAKGEPAEFSPEAAELHESMAAGGTAKRWFSRADWIIAFALFTIGTVLGTLHMMYTATQPAFYQEYYATAVGVGCGFGFVNMNQYDVPELDAFLSLRRDAVDCGAAARAGRTSLNAWQKMHIYQMGAAGLLWRLRGEVSWRALAPLHGILSGATIALVFAISRLALSRMIALGVGLVLLVSPANLAIVPLLRDYSKAPFILASILLIGIIGTQRMSWRASLLLAAVGGAITGVGFGFRTDVLIVLPPMVFAFLALSAGRFRESWRRRAASALLYVVVFMIVALPAFRGMQEGGGNAHVTLLGQGSPFDAQLGLETPFYEWVYEYNDTQISTLLNGYAKWRYGSTRPVHIGTPAYERYGREYLLQLGRHFPADMLTRTYGAMLRVLELPANGFANKLYVDPNEHELGIKPPLMVGRYLSAQRIIQLLTGSGALFVLCAAVTLVLIAARSLRLATLALFIVLYFGGYTMLQFSLRHAFHLEFLGWLSAGFVVQAAFRAFRHWKKGNHPTPQELSPRRALIMAAVLAIVPAGVLYAARIWQDDHLREMVATYLAAAREPVAFSVEPGSASDRVLLRPVGDPPAAGEMRLDYLVVEARSDTPYGALLFRNRPIAAPIWDQTKTVAVQRPANFTDWYPSDVTRYFFPAYTGPEAAFEGVEIPRDALASVVGIQRIKPTSDLPFLLWMTLNQDWRERRRHQRFLSIEGRDTLRSFYDAPEPGGDEHRLTARDAALVGEVATYGRTGRLRIHGMVDATNSTYVQYASYKAKKGSTFIVEGTIHYGCITAIVNAAGVYLSLEATQPGPFRMELTVPGDGTYSPLLANLNCYGPNDVTIRRVRWVEP